MLIHTCLKWGNIILRWGIWITRWDNVSQALHRNPRLQQETNHQHTCSVIKIQRLRNVHVQYMYNIHVQWWKFKDWEMYMYLCAERNTSGIFVSDGTRADSGEFMSTRLGYSNRSLTTCVCPPLAASMIIVEPSFKKIDCQSKEL